MCGLQSGLSSRAKHGGTVFSADSGSIKDLTTVPGFCNHLGPPNLITFAPVLVFLSVLNVYSLPLNLEVVFAIFGQNGFLGQNI